MLSPSGSHLVQPPTILTQAHTHSKVCCSFTVCNPLMQSSPRLLFDLLIAVFCWVAARGFMCLSLVFSSRGWMAEGRDEGMGEKEVFAPRQAFPYIYIYIVSACRGQPRKCICRSARPFSLSLSLFPSLCIFHMCQVCVCSAVASRAPFASMATWPSKPIVMWG